MEKGKEKTFEKKVLRKFLQKLAPCIEHGDLDACAEEAALVAQEMGIGGGKSCWSYLEQRV